MKTILSAATVLILGAVPWAIQDDIPIKDERELITIENAQLSLIHNVEIASRDAGIIQRIGAKEGEDVLLDDLLVRLDKASFEAERSAAEAEVQIARKESENEVDLRYAEKSAEVNRKVLARSCDANSKYPQAISKTEIEQLELELERSILSGDQARHKQAVNELNLLLRQEQLNVAELRLKYRDIRSPIAGVVAEVFAEPGEWVASGQPVARVIGLNQLRVEGLLSQEFAFKVKKGQSATFTLLLGDQSLTSQGKVEFVSPEINPLTEEFLVRVEIDNSDRKLKPGFKGKLEIDCSE